ncbi:MAG: protease pro-enzyme activation domain-containing protein [Ktedonobacterales bacterium]
MRGIRLSRATGIRIGTAALILFVGFASVVYIHGNASAARQVSSSHVPFNAAHSVPIPNGADLLGHHSGAAQMQVEIVLHPQNESNLYPLIQALSTPGSALYQHWLTPAQFNADFPAPAFDTSWLTSHGLQEIPGPSPLVLAFTGTSSQFEAAFGTTINDYRTNDGRTVYANATAPSVPATAFPQIAGIIGLDNVSNGQEKPELVKPLKPLSSTAEPNQYGAGPGGGLVPSQIQGIYGANSIYKATQGQGVTTALFELSGYHKSDIRAYEKQFGLPKVNIQNIDVDGGPCNPVVLTGMPCDNGGVEDDLDIQLQQAMAPGISKIEVYLGPNDDQGDLDTYFAIANQNTAEAVSSSWGVCESGLDSGVAFGEYLAFAQMATQGQSISAAAGDAGAYDCEYSGFTAPFPPFYSNLEVDDPSSDPLMTAVGGTSFFGTYDPGSDLHPTYPAGKEYVWDTLDNCTTTDFSVDGVDISADTGYGVCPFGAGAGGNSMLWAKAPWQQGPGTTSSASEYGSYCGQASGVQCREVPDISLDADEYSGYAEYCADPGAGCSPDSAWFEVGGTSCSSPLWSAITALADSYGNHRVGLTTALLYRLDSPAGYSSALHDMVGGVTFSWNWSQMLSAISGTTISVPNVIISTNSNGYGTPPGFVETRDYDLATGLGTPDVSAIVPALASSN